MYDRWISASLRSRLQRPYVHLLFGARQTGKSTLLKELLPPESLHFNFADPEERTRHLTHPGEFAKVCRSLPESKKGTFVFVDEAQSVPSIFDAVQFLYDADKTRWRFILCGSSARKLRQTGANLLPGRSFVHHLFPLTMAELPPPKMAALHGESPLPFEFKTENQSQNRFPAWDLMDRLAYGGLPGIVTAEKEDRQGLLKTYSFVHLEEEIRREALVKDWGAFVRFLQLAAMESGQILNYATISQESGISQPTIKSHYQLLEDMFIGIRIPSYTKSPRKNILSSSKFLFFDLGIRHASAGLNPSHEIVKADPGPIFEQWVGTELWRRLNYLDEGKLYHQRSRTGAEIDFIIEHGNQLTPIEVKWTEHPNLRDARHLLLFLEENEDRSKQGYIICRTPRPMRLHDKIIALPWFYL